MSLNVDKVMARVRAEARRGQETLCAVTNATSSAFGERWGGALPPLPRKDAYALHELTAYSDMAYVENVYVAVLRRKPDPEGLQTYLRKLRTGEMSKVEILAALRWSPEGVARGVHVDGLLAPFLIHKWRRKPFIGPVVSWLHALVRLPALLARTSLVEASQAHQTTDLAAHISDALTQLAGRIDVAAALQVQVHSLQAQAQSWQTQIHSEREQMHSLQMQVAAMQEVLTDAQALEGGLAKLAGQISDMEGRVLDEMRQAGELRHHVVAHGAALAEAEQERLARRDFEHALAPMYVAFEQRFRGSPALIRERMLPYLDFIRDAQVGTHDKPLVDVGCGNGEWLEVLRDHGFSARGVDTNRLFVDLCRGRGLDIVEGDAVEVLRGLSDGSVGAVTGMHIAEHLPFEVLVALLDQCRRVLCIGGVLALETPNPENLLVASHHFYLDPTHRNPLPPEALRWIVEARGFQMCRIERWTIARDMPAPPLLAEDIPGAASVNALLSQLHAAPDYAIIARRL